MANFFFHGEAIEYRVGDQRFRLTGEYRVGPDCVVFTYHKKLQLEQLVTRHKKIGINFDGGLPTDKTDGIHRIPARHIGDAIYVTGRKMASSLDDDGLEFKLQRSSSMDTKYGTDPDEDEEQKLLELENMNDEFAWNIVTEEVTGDAFFFYGKPMEYIIGDQRLRLTGEYRVGPDQEHRFHVCIEGGHVRESMAVLADDRTPDDAMVCALEFASDVIEEHLKRKST